MFRGVDWRNWQEEGSEFLSVRKNGLLVLPTGQGKCLTGLKTFDLIRGYDTPTCIISPPKNALDAWETDIREKTDFNACFYPGNVFGHDLIVVPHSQMPKFIREVGLDYIAKHPIILDEVDAFINPDTSLYKHMFEVTRRAPFVWGMTATPIHNNLANTYWHVYMTFGGNTPLRSFEWFSNKFIVYQEKIIRRHGRRITIREPAGRKNMNILMQMMNTFTYKSTTSVDLKFKFIMENFTAREEDDYKDRAQEILRSGAPAAYIHSLQKLVDGVESTFSSKLDIFKDAVRQMVDRGNPFIVYISYHDTRKLLKPILEQAGVRVHEITGKTPVKMRRKIRESVQEGGGQCILMTKAGIRGSNLQYCESTLVYDTPTDVRDLIQLLGRQARLGSPFERWYVVFMGIRETVDEYKMMYIMSHSDVVREVMAGTAILPEHTETITKADIIKMRKSLVWKTRNIKKGEGLQL